MVQRFDKMMRLRYGAKLFCGKTKDKHSLHSCLLSIKAKNYFRYMYVFRKQLAGKEQRVNFTTHDKIIFHRPNLLFMDYKQIM